MMGRPRGRPGEGGRRVTGIGLFGAAGHMGMTLIRAIAESNVCRLAGGCERIGSPKIGADSGRWRGCRRSGFR